MPKLIVFRSRTKEATFDLDPAVECILGRGANCTVAIDSPLVSRRHARITWDPSEGDGAWMIEDIGGRNGLFVNGEQVVKQALNLGDFLEFGRHIVVFHESGASRLDDLPSFAGALRPMDEEQSTSMMSPEELARLAEKAKARLRTHARWKGEVGIEELELDDGKYLIGFTPECAIRLIGNPMLGKKAAVLSRDYSGNWTLEALSSLAAVRVNGKKVSGSRVVEDGDTISVKGQEIAFHSSLID